MDRMDRIEMAAECRRRDDAVRLARRAYQEAQEDYEAAHRRVQNALATLLRRKAEAQELTLALEG